MSCLTICLIVGLRRSAGIVMFRMRSMLRSLPSVVRGRCAPLHQVRTHVGIFGGATIAMCANAYFMGVFLGSAMFEHGAFVQVCFEGRVRYSMGWAREFGREQTDGLGPYSCQLLDT